MDDTADIPIDPRTEHERLRQLLLNASAALLFAAIVAVMAAFLPS